MFYIFCVYVTSVLFTGDRVIFAESPSAPGIPVVYRTPEERSSNPDRLNLDRYIHSSGKGEINTQIKLSNNKEHEFISEFYSIREGEVRGYYRF